MKSKLLRLLRKSIYKVLGSLDNIVGRKCQVIILCYHSVSNDDWRFGVSFEMLKKQINYLLKHYSPVSLDEIEGFISDKRMSHKPVFVITFDDGYKDIYQTKDFFEKEGIRPALFILSRPQDRNLQKMNTERPLLAKQEIMDLKESGWTIGSHGATHADLTSLSEKEIDEEIVGSKKTLESLLSNRVEFIAYPLGKYNSRVLSAVKKAGYKMGLSMDDRLIDSEENQLAVSRIGVDRTHSFEEFKNIFSPSSVRFRNIVSKLMPKPLI